MFDLNETYVELSDLYSWSDNYHQSYRIHREMSLAITAEVKDIIIMAGTTFFMPLNCDKSILTKHHFFEHQISKLDILFLAFDLNLVLYTNFKSSLQQFISNK